MGLGKEMKTYSFWILVLQTLIIAGVGAYIYLFGIPASFKRYLQDEALEQFGESKAKEYLKKGLDKVPDSDNPEVQKMRKQAMDKVPTDANQAQDMFKGLTGGKK